MTNIERFLKQLESFNLPIGQYVIVSSGPLAVRGIRECSDLDVLVADKLFEQLSSNHEITSDETFSKISVGDIDFLHKTADEEGKYSVANQIAEAEMIQGFPFQKLETCIHFKSTSGRPKDADDMILIKNYLNK